MKRGNGPLRIQRPTRQRRLGQRARRSQGAGGSAVPAGKQLGTSSRTASGTEPGREGEAGSKDKREGWARARARYSPVPPRLGSGIQARGARAAAPSCGPAPAARWSAGKWSSPDPEADQTKAPSPPAPPPRPPRRSLPPPPPPQPHECSSMARWRAISSSSLCCLPRPQNPPPHPSPVSASDPRPF